MIKKLRVKFVAILMLVVACLLGVSFGLFYTLTRQNLRTQSISMMQAIAANPLEPGLPGAPAVFRAADGQVWDDHGDQFRLI